MKGRVLAGLAGAALALPAMANDTMATLGAGGLVFVNTSDVRMVSEDLYVSPDEIRVTYEFHNDSTEDARSLVAFPLPDITGSPDFLASVPSEDAVNPFGFETTVNGTPVETELHQYVFAQNIEQTKLLRQLDIPLLPHSEAARQAIEALDEAKVQQLFDLGLVVPLEYDAGQGWERHFFPTWTLKTTYSWWAEFPAGETVTVTHSYRPSVGGTVAVTFLSEPYDDYDPASEYAAEYCTDDSFIAAVRRTLPNPAEPYGAPFTESWLTYIWSTGTNWSGPIGKFRLVVDKVKPENLVSFCWDGEVTKTGPTTFEMTATDFVPPYERELEILLLNRQAAAR